MVSNILYFITIWKSSNYFISEIETTALSKIQAIETEEKAF